MAYTHVDGLAELTEELVAQVTSSHVTRMAAVMQDRCVEPATSSGILQDVSENSVTVFEGLMTRHSRESFYTRHFNLVVGGVDVSYIVLDLFCITSRSPSQLFWGHNGSGCHPNIAEVCPIQMLLDITLTFLKVWRYAS